MSLGGHGGMTAVVLALVVTTATAIVSLAPGVATADGAVTIVLREVNDSGVTGSAIVSPAGDRSVVGLVVRGTTGGLPAHLHLGSCRTAEPMPLFPLTDAFPEAVTTTAIDLPLAEIRGGEYAIVVHRRAEDLAILLDAASIVACGDLGDGDSEVVGVPQSGTGATRPEIASGSWWTAFGGLALIILVVAVGRRSSGRVRERPV